MKFLLNRRTWYVTLSFASTEEQEQEDHLLTWRGTGRSATLTAASFFIQVKTNKKISVSAFIYLFIFKCHSTLSKKKLCTLIIAHCNMIITFDIEVRFQTVPLSLCQCRTATGRRNKLGNFNNLKCFH